eukprot:350714-Chlamydomonas_euryale.AAC.2
MPASRPVRPQLRWRRSVPRYDMGGVDLRRYVLMQLPAQRALNVRHRLGRHDRRRLFLGFACEEKGRVGCCAGRRRRRRRVSVDERAVAFTEGDLSPRGHQQGRHGRCCCCCRCCYCRRYFVTAAACRSSYRCHRAWLARAWLGLAARTTAAPGAVELSCGPGSVGVQVRSSVRQAEGEATPGGGLLASPAAWRAHGPCDPSGGRALLTPGAAPCVHACVPCTLHACTSSTPAGATPEGRCQPWPAPRIANSAFKIRRPRAAARAPHATFAVAAAPPPAPRWAAFDAESNAAVEQRGFLPPGPPARPRDSRGGAAAPRVGGTAAWRFC